MENKKELEQEIRALLLKHIQKQTTAEESTLVESWLSESEERVHELAILKQAYFYDMQMKEYKSFESSSGFKEVIRKLKQNKKKIWLNKISRIAAATTIPLLISSLAFNFLFFKQNTANNDKKEQFVEITSAPGVITRLELPDQSKVYLNSGSTLRYPVAFTGDTREVELTGEGFFEVHSNKEYPFFVTTKSGIKVMAHGTQFNVNTYDDREEVEAILVKGKVDIHSSGKMIANLQPGEKISYHKTTQNYTINQVNLYEKTAWKDGKLVFRNTTLNDVFKTLSQRFNVEIVCHGEHKDQKYKFWATFTNETIYQIFSYLEDAAPIKWKVNTLKQNADSTFAKQQIDVWIK